MSEYLLSTEYATYGVAAATPELVQQASNVIDAHLNRIEGLVYQTSPSVSMANTGSPIIERQRLGYRGPLILSRHPIAEIVTMRWGCSSDWTTISDTDLAALDIFEDEVDIRALVSPGVNVETTYVAGYLSSNVPMAVKQACANLVYALINTPEVTGNVTTMKAGDTQVTWEGTSLLDADSIQLLSPWRRSMA